MSHITKECVRSLFKSSVIIAFMLTITFTLFLLRVPIVNHHLSNLSGDLTIDDIRLEDNKIILSNLKNKSISAKTTAISFKSTSEISVVFSDVHGMINGKYSNVSLIRGSAILLGDKIKGHLSTYSLGGEASSDYSINTKYHSFTLYNGILKNVSIGKIKDLTHTGIIISGFVDASFGIPNQAISLNNKDRVVFADIALKDISIPKNTSFPIFTLLHGNLGSIADKIKVEGATASIDGSLLEMDITKIKIKMSQADIYGHIKILNKDLSGELTTSGALGKLTGATFNISGTTSHPKASIPTSTVIGGTVGAAIGGPIGAPIGAKLGELINNILK